MATRTVGHHPELTAEQAMDVFSRHFTDYEVYKTMFLNRDFLVKKSGWTGVGVRLKQESNYTTFIFTPLIPNFLLQMLGGGVIAYLVLRSNWKALEDEVASFIEKAPQFK